MTSTIPTFFKRSATFNWIPMLNEVLGLRLQLSWEDKVLKLRRRWPSFLLIFLMGTASWVSSTHELFYLLSSPSPLRRIDRCMENMKQLNTIGLAPSLIFWLFCFTILPCLHFLCFFFFLGTCDGQGKISYLCLVFLNEMASLCVIPVCGVYYLLSTWR